MSEPQTRLARQAKRAHPYVPEPYGERTGPDELEQPFMEVSGAYSLSRGRGFFLPETEIELYLESISEAEVKDLNARARVLKNHATENEDRKASLSTWESDIRADMFGRIRGDRLLRMDKITYKYRYKDPETSTYFLKEGSPAITFGLAPSKELSAQQQPQQHLHNNSTNRPSAQISSHTLQEFRIRKQLAYRKCGLIVDPRWTSTDLIFPWALFEINTSKQRLFMSIVEAASTYLGMLDDLARDPRNPAQYQQGAQVLGNLPQVFSFGCEGSRFWVNIAFDWFGKLMVEPVWRGDLSLYNDARVALATIDQIQNYAVTTHRQYVIRHLEPWIQLAEEELGSGGALDDMSLPFWKEVELAEEEGRMEK